MATEHHYQASITWTGNQGEGTTNYRAFGREHVISIDNKPDISGSSDPAFRGDKTRHNPEDLLLSSLSACHMLWYLHLCAEAGVVVIEYSDNATGTMTVESNGSGHFTEVTLNPIVTLKEPSMIDKANELHKKANEFCFIANSVNFPVKHKPTHRSIPATMA
jgi:organic hydroperoxide reductase OsmC/OhrA